MCHVVSGDNDDDSVFSGYSFVFHIAILILLQHTQKLYIMHCWFCYCFIIGVVSMVAASDHLKQHPPMAHLPDLPFGEFNVLVVTDVHSWIAGHERHESRMNVNYGNVLSLYETLQTLKIPNLWFVMNGDFMDGTGLSTTPPKHLTPLLQHMPFDLINMGNHELYHDETVDWIRQEYIPNLSSHQTYLTSNTVMADNYKPIGKRYTYIHNNDNTTTLLAFGFLYNFEGHCETTIVEHVQEVVQQEWFRNVVQDTENYQAILVMAHMHVTDPLVEVILFAIRALVGIQVPVQFITGHTHIRAYTMLDSEAASMEAGRFLDTIGFVSFGRNSEFQHVFIDANQAALHKTLGNENYKETANGKALTQQIRNTQQSLGLLQTIGCSVQTYDLAVNMNLQNSLWGLYMYQIIPNMLHLKEKGEDVFVQGTGALRYDLFHGQVLLDDLISVCPFNDTVYSISPQITGQELLQVLEIASIHPNDVIPPGYRYDLPYFAISSKTIQLDQWYTIITTEFHKNDMVKRIHNVTDYQVQATPIPSNDGFWTTTNLWTKYVEQEWPCWSQKAKMLEAKGKQEESQLDSSLQKEENPIAAFIFIALVVCGLWIYQKRKQYLQRSGYIPVADSMNSSSGLHGSSHSLNLVGVHS